MPNEVVCNCNFFFIISSSHMYIFAFFFNCSAAISHYVWSLCCHSHYVLLPCLFIRKVVLQAVQHRCHPYGVLCVCFFFFFIYVTLTLHSFLYYYYCCSLIYAILVFARVEQRHPIVRGAFRRQRVEPRIF